MKPNRIEVRGRCPRPLKRCVRRAASAALQAEGVEGNVELSLYLTTDRIVQRLNRRYRGINRPTDVLSFPQTPWTGDAGRGTGDGGAWATPSPHLGDVVISLPTAQRQADEQTWTLEQEVAWLTVHGVLHLLGYDDVTAAEREKMLTRQEEIFTGLRLEGVGTGAGVCRDRSLTPDS